MYARRLAATLGLALLAATSLVGCELFFPPPRADAGPIDAPDPAFPWRLGTVARGPHAPGTWLSFPVDEVTGSPDAVYLWVLEDDVAFPIRGRSSRLPPLPMPAWSEDDAGPEDAGLDAGTDAGLDGGAPRSFTYAAPLPIVRPGVYHLALGTVDAPMTRPAEVEVVVGTPRLSQAEAADALGAGLAGLTADVGSALHSDDPDWQRLVTDGGLAETLTAFDGMADDLDGLASLAREQYLALPADAEPGMQELLWNSGLLASLAARASGVSMLTFGGTLLDSAVARSPFQALLFSIDALSMLLATFGIVCDVVTIVGALVTLPAGGEGALVGVAPKIVIAILRVVIDGIIPTDLASFVEVQSSSVVFETEGSMVAPWGIFAPQNRMTGAVFRSFEDVVLAVVEAVLPGGDLAERGLRPAARAAGEYVLTHLPGFIADFLFQRVDFIPRLELLLPVDMGFYNIQLSQVVALHPVFAPIAAPIALLYDPELVSPFTATFARSGGRVTTTYDTRSVGFADVPFMTTAPTERVPAQLSTRGFAFASSGPEALDIQIVQIPLPVAVDARIRILRVQQAPDPADRSQRLSDEDFIDLDVQSGTGTTRIIRADTTRARLVTLLVNDLAGGRPDDTVFTVLVNGVPAATSVVITDGGVATVPLPLEPSMNEIQVLTQAGHTAIGCGPSGTDHICLELELVETDNENHRLALYGPVGVSRTFRVWTPPEFPAGM
jgi:hypothetical protein